MGAQQVPLSNSGVADPCLSLEQKDDTQAVKAEGRNLGTRQRGRKVTREEQKEESGLLKTHPLTGSVLLGYVSGPGKTKLQYRAGWVKTSNCKLWHDRLLGESPLTQLMHSQASFWRGLEVLSRLREASPPQFGTTKASVSLERMNTRESSSSNMYRAIEPPHIYIYMGIYVCRYIYAHSPGDGGSLQIAPRTSQNSTFDSFPRKGGGVLLTPAKRHTVTICMHGERPKTSGWHESAIIKCRDSVRGCQTPGTVPKSCCL